MIKSPSRKLINSSLRSDLPLCVNTYDYNSAGSTDPSVPLPSAVNITVNAPAKLSYPALGTSGFTSSGNSYGVSPLYPRLPFTVTNPTRILFKGSGRNCYYSVSPATTRNTAGAYIPQISVTRNPDSTNTVFDTVASSFNGLERAQKLNLTGYYLRSNSPYLFGVYGTFKSGTTTVDRLCFVYAPIKLLPQVFDLTCLSFDRTVNWAYLYDTPTGQSTDYFARGYPLVGVTESVGTFTCTTSPTPIDITSSTVQETFDTYTDLASGVQGSAFGVLIGVTSLAFTL